MTIYYTPGESIECSGARMKFRKIEPKLPAKKYSEIGKLNRYKLTRGCAVYIEDELNPKVPRIDKNSALNKGDGVDGNSIFVMTQNFISKTNHIVKKGSSKHKIQLLSLSRSFIYAKVEIQHPSIPQRT